MSDSISIGWFGPTHNQWDWIFGHFRNVTLLTERSVKDWIASQSQASQLRQVDSTPVFIAAIDTRFEPVLDLVKNLDPSLAQNPSDAISIPWCVLLGEDWVGHRRTYPLPETIQTFYWYEWYDRVLPWLVEQSQPRLESTSTDTMASTIKRKPSLRVQRLIDASLSMDRRRRDKSTENSIRLALVVTESATVRQLWCEALSQYEILCVSTTPENLELWVWPDIIILDMDSEPLVVRERQSTEEIGDARGQLVRRIANQFTKATIIVADPFPRWDDWKTLKNCGADLMVAKPFQLPGILDALERQS